MKNQFTEVHKDNVKNPTITNNNNSPIPEMKPQVTTTDATSTNACSVKNRDTRGGPAKSIDKNTHRNELNASATKLKQPSTGMSFLGELNRKNAERLKRDSESAVTSAEIRSNMNMKVRSVSCDNNLSAELFNMLGKFRFSLINTNENNDAEACSWDEEEGYFDTKDPKNFKRNT